MKAYFSETKNKYIIRYRDWNNPDHKEFRESFSKNDFKKKDVESKVSHINHKIKFSGYDPWAARRTKKKKQKLSYPLQDAIDEYIEDNMSSGNWLPKTKKGNEVRLGLLINHFGKTVTIDELSEEKLQHWLTGLDVKAVTKRSYSREVNPFLKWLHANGFTEKRWKVGVTRLEKQEIRNQDSIKYLTYSQLKDMERGYRWQVRANKSAGFLQKDYDEDKHPDAWWFMFWQGLRRKELPEITPADISGNRVCIQGKGNKIDWIYIVPPAQKIIKRRLARAAKGESLFGISHTNRLYKIFRRSSHLALGKDHPTGLHQLRHGCAVHYFTLGKSVQFVSKLLRHETIEVTLRVYADVMEGKLEEVFSDIEDKPAL